MLMCQEQLITPLVSLGHISMLAPDQFASPMKSVVANFIVKDLLMNDRVSFSLKFRIIRLRLSTSLFVTETTCLLFSVYDFYLLLK